MRARRGRVEKEKGAPTMTRLAFYGFDSTVGTT
jgi:hypothetical protein